MSYSQKIKTELCDVKLHCKSCSKAMLYGMLLFNKNVTAKSIAINTENKSTADFIANTIVEIAGVIVTVKISHNKDNKKTYTVSVDYENEINSLLKTFQRTYIDKTGIHLELLKKNCCKQSFLRGVFLTCGIILDPKKEYLVEFSVFNEELASSLLTFLHLNNFEFKMIKRDKNYIVYTKDSEIIEDIITYLGCVKSVFDFINIKIEKEIRNNANRITNCETANIEKTVNASLRQIKCINHIKETIGFDALPPQLKEIAVLRNDNPDLSLNELVSLLNNSISKSGLNHRLKKICDIANEIK